MRQRPSSISALFCVKPTMSFVLATLLSSFDSNFGLEFERSVLAALDAAAAPVSQSPSAGCRACASTLPCTPFPCLGCCEG